MTAKDVLKRWQRKVPRTPDRRNLLEPSPVSPSPKELKNEQSEQLTVGFGQCITVRSRRPNPPINLFLTIDEFDYEFRYAKITFKASNHWSFRKTTPDDLLEHGGKVVMMIGGETQEISVDEKEWSLQDVLFIHIVDRGHERGKLKLCFSNKRKSYLVPRGEKKK